MKLEMSHLYDSPDIRDAIKIDFPFLSGTCPYSFDPSPHIFLEVFVVVVISDKKSLEENRFLKIFFHDALTNPQVVD